MENLSFSLPVEQKIKIKKYCSNNNLNLSQFIRAIVLDRIAYLELKGKKK
jgi:hypothetical protein